MLDSPKASMEDLDEFRLGGRCGMAFAYQKQHGNGTLDDCVSQKGIMALLFRF